MKYQYRKTASGERFNNYSMTAAHKSLPFGTKVKVKNATGYVKLFEENREEFWII